MGNIFPQIAAGLLAAKDVAPTNAPTPTLGDGEPMALGLDPEFAPAPAVPEDLQLTSPFLDTMDAQDQAMLDKAVESGAFDEPADTGAPEDVTPAGPGDEDEIEERMAREATTADPLADLQDRLYTALQSPEVESLVAAGYPKNTAVNMAFPDLAAERDAAIMETRAGTGSGQTLEGPR